MSEERASFVIDLRDETSAPANDAASALEALQKKIKEDTAELRNMQKALRNLKGAKGETAEAAKALKDKIDAQKAAIAKAQARYVQLGGTFGPVTRGTHVMTSGFSGLLDRVGAMPGPLGAMGSRLSGLLNPAAALAAVITAVTAAMAALATAAGAATAALFRYGLAQSNARRAELVRLEGLTTIRRWHGLAAGSATEMQAAIDRVSDATGVGRGQLEAYTRQLHRMGLRGENLNQALEGMAIVGAVQGERWARQFASMSAGVARTGGEVRRLADDVRARLGGIARRRMLDLTVQTELLRERLRRIFGDLRIEGFLQGLADMTRMLSQSTATGRALKAIVEAMFNPFLDALGEAQPLARRFFQGMVLGAQMLAIQVLRLAIWFRRTFGSNELIRGLDAQKVALYAGIAVVATFVGVMAAAAVAVGLVAAAVVAVAATVASMVSAFAAAAAAVGGLIFAGVRLAQWFRDADFEAMGRALVDGLVRGIERGANRVRNSIQGMARRARGALESALGIASPSRVFAELGAQIPAGLAQGVERGGERAQSAVDDLVAVPTLRATGGGQTYVSIDGGIHVHAQNGEQARDVAEHIREQLAEVLEGLGVSLGAPEPGGAA